jgi:hypothetical protein
LWWLPCILFHYYWSGTRVCAKCLQCSRARTTPFNKSLTGVQITPRRRCRAGVKSS